MTKPKFRKATFDIAMLVRGKKEPEIHPVQGMVCEQFGIHSEGRGCWKVTYLPEGTSVGNAWTSQKQARAFVGKLLELDFHARYQADSRSAPAIAYRAYKEVTNDTYYV